MSISAGHIFVDDGKLAIGRMLFAETLSLNESRTRTIKANEPFNWSGIKLINGQTYKFTVGSPEWNNGPIETTAAGYTLNPAAEAASCPRRYPSQKWMALIGEIYDANQAVTTFKGWFHIGSGRTWKANRTGYLAATANDCFIAYADNSRVVTLTIKRVQ